MKILNLYAGGCGNRKLWGNEHEITAVENVDYIADVYHHFYPNDTLIREDAHQYLLDHHHEFDFIWASPPCPTHSRLNLLQRATNQIPPRYPDMKLYQEIIFLKQWFKGKWIVENVEPYYLPLMQPSQILDRHCIWANFSIPKQHYPKEPRSVNDANWQELEEWYGIKIPDFVQLKKKRLLLLLRNVARPDMGEHILRSAMRETVQQALTF